MRHVLLHFALFTLLSTCASAQVLTVSDELPMRNDTEYNLIGVLGNQTLLFQDRDSKHLLTAFDGNMRQSWEKELELRGRNSRFIEAIAKQDGTGFHLIYLFRKEGHNFLQTDFYNPAGVLRDSATIVDLGNSVADPDENFTLSEDESKMAIIFADQASKPRIVGLDLDELQLTYDHKLAPERFFFGEDFLQAEINNDGELFFIIERDNFRSKRKDHRYEVHRLSEAGSQQFDLTMGDSLTYDMFFRYDNMNNRLVAGGLYTARDFSRADGYFWISVDPEQPSTSTPKFTPFPLPLVKNIEGRKFNKKKPGIDEITVRNIVLRHDGGGLIITERNRQLERRSNASRMRVISDYGVRPLVDYHYDELIVFAVQPDGGSHWSNILHKKQYSQDDGGVYSGYFLLENPRSLRFLFNDEIRFENTVSEYVLNGRGEFDRNSLFNTRDLNLRLRFKDGVQVAANELIVPSEHRNRLRLVRMTYRVSK